MKPQSKTVAAAVAPKVTTPVAIPAPTSVTLARSTALRKGSSIIYVVPGLRAVVKVARAAFEGNPPDALVIVGSPFAAPKMPMAKLSKEERKALRDKLTPADRARIARERANRAAAKAAKLEAALAAKTV